jgi:hypothetical protein
MSTARPQKNAAINEAQTLLRQRYKYIENGKGE